jgi:serine/threonine-protein phosphatase 2B catalytic subunit
MNDQHGRRKPNAEFLRDHFIHEGRLTEDQALAILRQCTDVLAAEPNLLKVKSPVTGMSPSYRYTYTDIETFT